MSLLGALVHARRCWDGEVVRHDADPEVVNPFPEPGGDDKGLSTRNQRCELLAAFHGRFVTECLVTRRLQNAYDPSPIHHTTPASRVGSRFRRPLADDTRNASQTQVLDGPGPLSQIEEAADSSH